MKNIINKAITLAEEACTIKADAKGMPVTNSASSIATEGKIINNNACTTGLDAATNAYKTQYLA